MPNAVDHVIYAVPDLATGIERVAALLGVRPEIGGRHPAFGTRNALLSLGGGTYLEVMAHDPELPPPGRGVLFALDRLPEPRVITWVLRAEDVDERADRSRAAGVPIGQVVSGGRERPDGSALTWRFTDPYAFPFGGVVPFLIAWGRSPHPSATLPVGGALEALELLHPEAERAGSALRVLGSDLPVHVGDRPRVRARIRTDRGLVELA